MKDKNWAEIHLHETMEALERVEMKLRKIEAMADMILTKSCMSHSLLVVRKVSEDKVDELNQILD